MESWKHRKTLILGRTDMIGLLTPKEYNDCVEHAYRMHGLGRVYMEPKGHIASTWLDLPSPPASIPPVASATRLWIVANSAMRLLPPATARSSRSTIVKPGSCISRKRNE